MGLLAGFSHTETKGQYEKGIEVLDKAIQLQSARCRFVSLVWRQKSSLFRAAAGRSGDRMGPPVDHDQSELLRTALAVLAAALALTGHEAEARDAEQRRIAVLSPSKASRHSRRGGHTTAIRRSTRSCIF